MNNDHFCEHCGKKMKRLAQCEFYCNTCDKTVFDWSLQYESEKKKPKEFHSDFELADFCHGGDLSDD